MIKNIIEDEIVRRLPDLYQIKPDLCRCRECRDDLLALTLQRLPPKYTSRRIGEVFSRLEIENQQWQVDILETMLYAAGIVAEKPHHSL
ncbi:MAG TPA: late competence development ComFB family protein [Atribacteraceae bacterium]|nr:late competence development ComFB family protein [Atribacteraceae bacterium]